MRAFAPPPLASLLRAPLDLWRSSLQLPQRLLSDALLADGLVVIQLHESVPRIYRINLLYFGVCPGSLFAAKFVHVERVATRLCVLVYFDSVPGINQSIHPSIHPSIHHPTFHCGR